MKIILKNFKCYEDKTIDLGDTGLSLISAPSGAGKTSIISAVYFALFGVGTKVVLYGKTSCRVELHFDDLKIVRTKKPNRLVLNDVYEDQAAQDIINERFGNTFNVTGYIAQNALNSFILMSPVDKLLFLEKFAFKDVDLNNMKSRCKALISRANDELVSATSQLQLTENYLSQIDMPDKVDFPIKCGKSQRDLVMANEIVKSKNCETKIKKFRNVIRSTQTELNAVQVLNAVISGKQESIDDICDKLNLLIIEEGTIQFQGEEKFNEYKCILESLRACRELVNLESGLVKDEKQLSVMKAEEIGVYTDKITAMRKTLWSEYCKDECDTFISDYKSIIDDMEKVNVYKSKILGNETSEEVLNDMEKQMQVVHSKHEEKSKLYSILVSQKEMYTCPNCSVSLKLKDGKLVSDMKIVREEYCMGELKNEIKELSEQNVSLREALYMETIKYDKKVEYEKKLQDLESSYEELPDLDDVREDLKYIIEYKAEQIRSEKTLKNLENKLETEEFSVSYVAYAKDVYSKKCKVLKLQEMKQGYTMSDFKYTEDEISVIINEQSNARSRMNDILENKSTMELDKLRYANQKDEKIASHIEKYGKISMVESLELIISEKEKEISLLEKKKIEHSKNLIMIDKWKIYSDSMVEYSKRKKEVLEYKKVEVKCRKKYAAANLLKEKILEAESIAMVNIIGSIDMHARIYLDAFFDDNPMVARLQAFKVSKKNIKPQINIEIDYKGMECDLTMLSGGELSRVILAYTLALNEMFNTPLLMLDECTSSLDQDSTELVFDAIKEHFQDKLVVVIAHQSVIGSFSRVVDI